jgi:hypothetical protein
MTSIIGMFTDSLGMATSRTFIRIRISPCGTRTHIFLTSIINTGIRAPIFVCPAAH